MGCTSSRVANKDTVRRCRERRRLMKEAVYSRHHLAAAHSDYVRSLRHTAAALSRFASFQPLSVSNPTPLVLPRSHPPPSAAATPPPKPPPQHYSPSPPSPSIASSKLPHILSGKSTPLRRPQPPRRTYSTYSATPSQASSAWNWEIHYPPSPPGSDYFDRFQQQRQQQQEEEDHHIRHQLPKEDETDESEGEEENGGASGRREEVHCSDWGDDRYSKSSTSSTKSDGIGEGDADDDLDSRSEATATMRSDYYDFFAPSASASAAAAAAAAAAVPANHGHQRHCSVGRAPTSEFGASTGEASGRKERWRQQEEEDSTPTVASSVHREDTSSASATAGDLQMVVSHKDLKDIVAAIEDYFLKAAAAGEALSDMLENGREQLDRSFRQLRKTVYHSNSVLSNLSSTWTSKPPLAIKYRLDTASLEESGGRRSHCSTLERLLAWEKKLYQEVKAREGVKIEHQKKLSALQSQECKGKDDMRLDKTKAAIQRLHSLILVTSQAVSATSSAIIKVRDDELAPQLLEICSGFLNMWRSMHQFHEVQNQIVQQVRTLVNHSAALESTSDLHRQATRDLESAVTDWHSSFTRLIKFHREYIRALYAWLKLTLFQVSNDELEMDHDPSLVSSKLCAFCDEWKQALDRVPDTVAAEALKSFISVIHSISLKQTEEVKIKKHVESYSKELEKKSLALRSIEKKFYQSYSTVGIGHPGERPDSCGQVFDTRDPLAEKKSEIAACRRKVEEEMSRHTKAIMITRDMTLNNIQTGLPGVFQAMTGFSGLFKEALEGVLASQGLKS